MEGDKKIESLFSIKLPQCTHILNMQYHMNPQKGQPQKDKGNLFLGGVGSYKQVIMNGFKIRAVLSILGQKRYQQCQIKQKVETFNIKKHKWIELQDKVQQDVAAHFDQTYQFIKQSLQQNNVLVHCQFGRSRSASILIAFLMRQFKMRFNDAYKMVFAKRDQLQINEGFVRQLQDFEMNVFDQEGK